MWRSSYRLNRKQPICGHPNLLYLWVNFDVVLFRIAVLNDFRKSFAFIDYKRYGIMRQVGAGFTSQPHKGYDISSDCITLFINYDQVRQLKSRTDAERLMRELLAAAPPECAKDIEELAYYLFRAI